VILSPDFMFGDIRETSTMTKLIQAKDLSSAWLDALEHLLKCGGKDTNVIAVIERVDEEILEIRQLLDAFLQEKDEQRGKEFTPVTTVANTIFPQAFYQPRRGKEARAFLYQAYEHSFAVAKRYPPNHYGKYFQRMISWPVGKVNQLEAVINRLSSGLSRPNLLSSAYEIGISNVVEADMDVSETEEIRIYRPGYDGRLMGFPCLSHISLTLFKRRLHLTALYRNQYFIHKAYGNYVGLSRLLRFLCQEIGCEPGELTCVASHADAELTMGKQAITQLIQRGKSKLSVRSMM
jgi:thymidylate synthase